MSYHLLLSVLLLTPLLGALFNGIRYKNQNYKLAGGVATVASAISFACSVNFLWTLLQIPEKSITVEFFKWISVDSLQLAASFNIDPVSACMILVVTGVGTLIHLFSVGYMSHDDRPSKYFSYLNLFLFNMLILCLGDNLPLMFVGWEGVGLCSYLLIGFWFTDDQKAAAGMKAFITNRIGDAGFLLGMFFLLTHFQTLNFSDLSEAVSGLSATGWSSPLGLATLCLFLGAVGKSAQIPLYVWLPDAMAGPTPVSALIHAATMVTAGVYLIIRMSAIFVLVPDVMYLIALVGALTAFMAATIGMTQWDIKKILAYSTISQLGYMFLAVGLGAFIPALFHLITHAFFKALMFLGAGSVIHGMHEQQDIRKMGGLQKLLPITHFTFLIGWLAIIGIPPFAGFFSKDEILWHSFAKGHIFLWVIAALTAVLTAFYMTRLMTLTFWVKPKFKKIPHESPAVMWLPLVILAGLSLVGGWIGIPHILSAILPGHIPHLLHDFVSPFVSEIEVKDASAMTEGILMFVSILLAGAGAYFSYYSYAKNPMWVDRFISMFRPLHQLIYNKYKIDEFYSVTLIRPTISAGRRLWYYLDVMVIDKITYLISDFMISCGRVARSLQSGRLQNYALSTVLGVLIFFVLFMVI